MSDDVKLVLEVFSTLASVSVPFVLVWAAHRLQRQQKSFEAVMGEKLKHYAVISPLCNLIYTYRARISDHHDRTPESVLEAKRRADHEFHTFEYLWSDGFRRAYAEFMAESFRMFNPEGGNALIRADAAHHRVKPSLPGWPGFTGERVDRARAGVLYGRVKEAMAHDLGFPDYRAANPTARTSPADDRPVGGHGPAATAAGSSTDRPG